MENSVFHRFLNYGGLLILRLNSRFPFLERLWDLASHFRKVEVILFKGTIRNGSNRTSTLFVGSQDVAYLIADLMYSKIDKAQSLGKYPSFQVKPRRLPNADIIVACVGKLLTRKFTKNGYILLPSVSFTLNLKRPTCDMVKAMSRRRRRDLAKLKTHNYSYKVARAPDDEKNFDIFYWKMYHPYITRRFGKAAIPRSYLESKDCYKNNGGIIFVQDADKPIAGILFQTRGKTVKALSLGVYDGNTEHMEALAGQAALFFLIEWAKSEGIVSLNYGHTAPFPTYGNFEYKKEWGMTLEKEDAPFCALKLNNLTRGSLSFLSQNPFIFSDETSMKIALFADHSITRTELEHITHEYQFPKIDSLVIISANAQDTEPTSSTEAPMRNGKAQNLFTGPLSNACTLLQRRGLNVKTYEVSAPKHSRTPKNHRIESAQPSVPITRWFNRFTQDFKHATLTQQTLNSN